MNRTVRTALRRWQTPAAILVQVAGRHDIPFHLPLGVNAVEGSIRPDEEFLADDRRRQEHGCSADFGEPHPVVFPPDTSE